MTNRASTGAFTSVISADAAEQDAGMNESNLKAEETSWKEIEGHIGFYCVDAV